MKTKILFFIGLATISLIFAGAYASSPAAGSWTGKRRVQGRFVPQDFSLSDREACPADTVHVVNDAGHAQRIAFQDDCSFAFFLPTGQRHFVSFSRNGKYVATLSMPNRTSGFSSSHFKLEEAFQPLDLGTLALVGQLAYSLKDPENPERQTYLSHVAGSISRKFPYRLHD